MIVDAALEFSNNRTNLEKTCLQDLAKLQISSISSGNRAKICLNNEKTGNDWINSFLNYHEDVTLRKRVSIRTDREKAMNAESLSIHFAQIKTLMNRYKMDENSCIFNHDESGLSLNGITLGLSKSFTDTGNRGIKKMKFKGSLDNITLLSVFSVSRQILNPLFVFAGKEAQLRKQLKGMFETANTYFLQPHYIFKRPMAGVDSNIFF